MTESLRERCIEAVEDEVEAWFGPNDDDDDIAADIVDAVLDVLEESAEEWADYPAHADPIVVAHREIVVRKLVGVLRGNGE